MLTFCELPTDLDSHLKTPVIEGQSYHIYYSDPGMSGSPPCALLDIDDITSYGPETVTIYELKAGEYRYFIHNYSGSPEINTSNAVVQIFTDNGLLHTLQVPTSGSGLYWDVCTLNGSTGNITIINQVTDNEPGGQPYPGVKLPAKKPVEGNRNIISGNWAFGDGGTSTVQNPAHTYTASGSYAVSLTVSDGTNSRTETKTACINAGQSSVEERSWHDQVVIYPNPARGKLNISSPWSITTVSLVDLGGQRELLKESLGRQCTLDLGTVREGVYILTIATERGTLQKKLNVLI